MFDAMLVDTHTHLYLEDFENGGADAVRRAIEAGVRHMIMPNVDIDTIARLNELALMFPENISIAMGLHPTEVREEYFENLAIIETLIKNDAATQRRYVAVGEIGMDLYWDKTYRTQQADALERQLALARQLDLPVIIHCRDALDATLEVMSEFKGLKGVFHSFGGDAKDVERIRHDHDFYFGINGIVTFKNSSLGDTLPAIGASRILLETDSPYLAPAPKRGRRNESAYLTHIADHVAARLHMSAEQIATITSHNAATLFNLALH